MFCPQDHPFPCIGIHYIRQDDMDAGLYDTSSSVTSTSPNGSTIADTTSHSAGLSGVANVTVGEETAGHGNDGTTSSYCYCYPRSFIVFSSYPVADALAHALS